MQRHVLLLFLLIGFLFNGFAQEFEVRSFEADPTDLAARRYERRTVNDEPAALIKVITNIEGMRFDSNLGIVDIDRRDGEYWVYVAPRERRVRLLAENYLAKDLEMPEPAEPSQVYTMIVATKGLLAPPADLTRVTFRMNEENVLISSGERAPVSSAGRNAVYNLPKGEHRFRFIKDGFEEQTLTIEVEQEEVIDIELEPGSTTTDLSLPGYIVVETDPPGAEIYLNEQRVGTTPYQGRQLAGSYELKLTHPLYHEYATEFALEEGATVNLTNIEMQSSFGYWQLTTSPDSAEVFLDGQMVGTSPLPRGEISSGGHELRISKPLYHDHVETFTIDDGEEKTLSVEMEAAHGHLIINSDPQGADVFINDRHVGTTPYENPRKPSGRYNLRLAKDMYSESREQVTVEDEEQTSRFIPMSRNYGALEVHAEGADIYLDGRHLGQDNWQGNLSPGRYTLRASKDMHNDAEQEVFIVIGQTERLELFPSPKEGALSVETRPFEARGADVLIDGVPTEEVTPTVIPLLIGNYNVTVTKNGYLDSSQTIDIEEGQEHELVFDMETFEGSLMQEAGRHRTAKRWYGTAALMAAGAGAYFQYSSMQLADDYQTATTDAADIFEKMEQHELISYVSLGAAIPLGVMMITRSVRQRRAEERIELSAVPLKEGVVFGLVVRF